jgi:hypothetical protein
MSLFLIFPAMIVLALLLAGAITAMAKWPKPTLAVIGAVVVVVVLMSGLLISVRVQQSAVVEPMGQVSSASAPAMPEDWDPDVHPSIREAALSRVPVMERTFLNLTGGAYPPAHVHVRGDVDIDVLREFAERLGEQEAFSEAHITWKDGEQPTDGQTITINVNMHVDRQRRQHWAQSGVRQEIALWRGGRVMVTAARGGRTRTAADARFIEKPWADDWTGFLADSVPGQNWLRFESTAPATSPQEAHELAIEQAVQALVPMVRASSAPGRVDVVQEVRRQLLLGQLVTDRFIRRVDRPYGQLYMAMLLIDGSADAVQSLGHEVAEVRAVQRQAALGTAGSLAGLMGVIGLLYLGLNAATKGYYRPQLMAVAVGAIAAAMAVILFA